jgi:hypothetical protein
LETLPTDQYRTAILRSNNCRTFVQGALAMLVMDPDRDTCRAILDRCAKFMDGFLSDPDFLDLLRVVQLSLARGQLKPEDAPDMAERIAHEYPTRSKQLNRELVRLVAYLGGKSAQPRMLEQLTADVPMEDKMQVALLRAVLERLDDSAKAEPAPVLREGPHRQRRTQFRRLHRQRLPRLLRRLDRRRAGDRAGPRLEMAKLRPVRFGEAAGGHAE